jgi:putative transposase
MYWSSSHCRYDCRYHIVWITKYRRSALSPAIQQRLQALFKGICDELYVRVIEIGMEADHVHLYLTIPPVQPLPYVVQILKGRTAKIIRKEFAKELSLYYWKPVLWAVGYFVATVGEITHETIQNYVQQQGKKDIENECSEVEGGGEATRL